MQAIGIPVQLRPKFKFDRPNLSIEVKVDPARPNQDPTAEIQLERLDQKY